jgi:hypothetical protein
MMQSKLIILLALGAALTGAAVANYFIGQSTTGSAVDTQQLTARVEQLEALLANESEARKRVESRLDRLANPDSSLTPGSWINDTEASTDLPGRSSESTLEFIDEEEPIIAESNNQPLSPSQIRRQTLIAGGFTADEADWIAAQEAQAELDQLYAQHRLQREALAENTAQTRAWQQQRAQSEALREKLGEDYYERYLEANGWPTSADVRSVIKGSPAALAGLQPGDQIRSYAGERVFNMRDVSRLTLQGNEGETVLLEVERDGTTLQLTIPRGPIGVSSSSYRFQR